MTGLDGIIHGSREHSCLLQLHRRGGDSRFVQALRSP
jgi:hypothetical protein